MGVTTYEREAAEVIAEYEDKAALWRQHLEREMELEAARPIAKAAAVRRIMETENPDTGKPHSATSAEKVVESDAEYAEFLKTLRGVTLNKHAAYSAVVAANLRAELAIALAGGVR
jgi:hypothetical protein